MEGKPVFGSWVTCCCLPVDAPPARTCCCPTNFHSLLVHKEAYLQQHTLQQFFGVFWQRPWLTLADHSEQYVRHGDRDLDLSDYHRRQDEEGDGIVER